MTERGHDRDSSARPRRRAEWLLGIGAAAGLGLAALSILEPAPVKALPEGAIAVVNGVEIRRADFQAALDIIERNRRDPVTDEDRSALVDRLIEEELMIQQGRALGIDRQDHVLRGGLIAALQESIIAAALSGPTSDEALAEFYRANAEFFSRVTQVRVHQMWIPESARRPADAARKVAVSAAERVRAGESFDAVTRELGTTPPEPVPDRLVDLAKLRRIIGATAAGWAFELGEGQVSDPIHKGEGYLVLFIAQRGEPEVPPLDTIEARVRAEMGRRQRSEAIRNYLDELRRAAEIRTAPP